MCVYSVFNWDGLGISIHTCSMVDPTLSECICLLQECEQRTLQSGGHVNFWWLSQRVHDQVISAVSTWGVLIIVMPCGHYFVYGTC